MQRKLNKLQWQSSVLRFFLFFYFFFLPWVTLELNRKPQRHLKRWFTKVTSKSVVDKRARSRLPRIASSDILMAPASRLTISQCKIAFLLHPYVYVYIICCQYFREFPLLEYRSASDYYYKAGTRWKVVDRPVVSPSPPPEGWNNRVELQRATITRQFIVSRRRSCVSHEH